MSWQAQLDAFLAMSERDKCRLCEEEFHLEMDDWREGNRSKPVRILLTQWIANREQFLRTMIRGSGTGRTQHTQPNMQSFPGTGSKFVEDAMEGYCRKDIEFEMSFGWLEDRMIEWLDASHREVVPTQSAITQYVDNQLAMYRAGAVSMRTTFKNLGVSPDAIDDNGNYIEIKTYKGKS